MQLFHQISTVVSQGGREIKLFNSLEKHIIVISFPTYSVTMRFDDDFRFRTTTDPIKESIPYMLDWLKY